MPCGPHRPDRALAEVLVVRVRVVDERRVGEEVDVFVRSRRHHRQRLPPADGRRRCELRALSMSTSHSGNRFRISSSATRPSSRASDGAEAEVDAVAEREVLADRRGGCRTSRRSGYRRSSRLAAPTSINIALPSGHGLAVELDVAGDVPADVRRRAARTAAAPRSRSAPATGPRPARAAGRGARTAPCRPSRSGALVVSLPAPAITLMYVSASWRVSRRVTPCSSSNSACDQLGHEIVGRVLDPLVEVLAELLERPRRVELALVLLRLARLGADVRVGVLAHRLLVRLRGSRAACR